VVWQEVEVCDVVVGINVYEESRVAKGYPSVLDFETRSNGQHAVCIHVGCVEERERDRERESTASILIASVSTS
jgi:hypothetical protein